MRGVTLPLALLFALLGSVAWPVRGEEPEPATDALIAQERTRAAVEQLLIDYLSAGGDGNLRQDQATLAVERLVELGPDALPYLINELEQAQPPTFDFCAYALSRFDRPEVRFALHDAIERAEAEPTDQAQLRKAWAIWALGLLGEAEALLELDAGRHRSSALPMHSRVSVLEAVALQTAPESVPFLIQILERQVDDPDLWQERRATFRALRRVGDASVAPLILPYLKHEDPLTRRAAAHALGVLNAQETAAGLVDTMEDTDLHVRRAAGLALDLLGPTSQRDRILALLESESDAKIRAALYRAVARGGGTEAFDKLTAIARELDDVAERGLVLRAIAAIDDPRQSALLIAALDDEAYHVVSVAVNLLAVLHADKAVEPLIALLADAERDVVQSVPVQLALIGDSRAAAPIATRLLAELAEPVEDADTIHATIELAQALVELRHAEPLAALREGRERQKLPRLTAALDRTLRQLEWIAEYGDDAGGWIKAAGSGDPELRELAYRRLAEIDSSKAARWLLRAFDDLPQHRLEILRALGSARSDRSLAPIQRVLLDAAFDAAAAKPLRDMAAWSARRRGGEAMFDLLAASARRRQGRDAVVLVYAALLGQERALPLLRELRRQRMRYLGWYLGVELDRLDWVTRELEAGHSIAAMDQPPELLKMR